MALFYWFAEQIENGDPIRPPIYLTWHFLQVKDIHLAQPFEDRESCINFCIDAGRKLGLPFDAIRHRFSIPQKGS